VVQLSSNFSDLKILILFSRWKILKIVVAALLGVYILATFVRALTFKDLDDIAQTTSDVCNTLI